MKIKRLRKKWRRFATIGLEDASHHSQRVRVYFLNNLSLVAIITALFFSLLNFLEGNYLIGIFEISFALLVTLNFFVLHKIKNYSFSSNFLLALSFLFGLVLVLTGGLGGTGIFWLFLIPLVSFFLIGERGGLIWSASLILLGIALLVLADMNVITTPYTFIELRQFIATLFIMTVILNTYEKSSEQNRKLIAQRTNDLVKSYKKIKKEADAKEDAQSRLKKVLKEAEKRNEHLEKTKLAITNLLEDLQTEKEKIKELSLKDETMLRSIGEGLIATNEEGVIIRVSESVKTLLSKETSELEGKKVTDVFKTYDFNNGKEIPVEERMSTKALKEGEQISTRCQIERGDGSRLYALVRAVPYRIRGQINGAVITIRDITNETEIDKAKTEFVSLASHQLRTPLTAINWYTEMIKDGQDDELSDEAKEYLGEIQYANRRMVELVNSLLNVSRIDLGRFKIEPELTDLHKLIRDVVKELKEQITTKDLKVKLEFDRRINKLNLDKDLAYIIMQNLITNAVKYTPDEGHVWLRTRQTDNKIVIEVEDDGYGIPEGQQSQIFSKLFRADNVQRKETDGTGLGLYIVKAIIEESGGGIDFESEEGKGTIFRIILPNEGMKEREGSRGITPSMV